MNSSEEIKIQNTGMRYETFLARAFKSDLRIRRAHKQEFINLVNAENGEKLSFLPNFHKQLEEVKNRLNKAINIFIKKCKCKEQIHNLKEIEIKIYKIQSYRDINGIIEAGLENTKNFM